MGYDGIGELKSDQASDAGGALTRWNEQLEYVYDLAGNLIYRTNNALIQNFSTSANNELTQQTNWGRLTVMGTTTSTATNVTVGGTNYVPIYTDATFAATNMLLANSYTAIAQDSVGRRATNTVTVNLTNNSVFKYDLNGNLTNDGLRTLVFDDENELIQVSVSNQWMSQFQYDGKMRRRVRKEFTWTNSAWAQTNVVCYLYDGNLVIQERDQNNLPNVTYTHGKDLSGSLEGGGGIGGLLARTDATSGPTAFYHADGNGNVTMLINSTNAIVAKYLYDAFGNVLSRAGSLCDANLYRFSSKEAHPPSGLDYYLYRYYDANLQRWPNRDPIEEFGGINLYEFVGNLPIQTYDSYGEGWRENVANAISAAALAWNLVRGNDPATPPVQVPKPPSQQQQQQQQNLNKGKPNPECPKSDPPKPTTPTPKPTPPTPKPPTPWWDKLPPFPFDPFPVLLVPYNQLYYQMTGGGEA